MSTEHGPKGLNLNANNLESSSPESIGGFSVPEFRDAQWPTSPTPLRLTTDPWVNEQQRVFVNNELPARMMRYTQDAPKETINLVKESLMSIQHRRGIENGANYAFRLVGPLSKEVQARENAAAEGRATPYGILLLMDDLELKAAELAKTTFEGNQWPIAREEVRTSMLQFNPQATWHPNTIDKRARIGRVAKYQDGSATDKIAAFTLRVRKFRGKVNDSRYVREQLSFMIRTDDASGFDEWLLDKYPDHWDHGSPRKHLNRLYNETNTPPRIPTRFQNDHYITKTIERQTQVGYVSGDAVFGSLSQLMDPIETAITDDGALLPKCVIPLTQTFYAYDPGYAEYYRQQPPCDTAALLGKISVF